MIPARQTIQHFWDTYQLPSYKRNHCLQVARLSLWFASRFIQADPTKRINTKLLEAGALLHDVDKLAPKKDGERHPEGAVRILRKQGYHEVADLVRTHPLHAILDQKLAPKTIEQKLLYLSDKMVKHTIITVDERFALWRSENLPPQAIRELDAAYPKVKGLEKEICLFVGVTPEEIAVLANRSNLSTMKLS